MNPSQKSLILNHLKKGFSITQEQAQSKEFGRCFRLAVVIDRLRKKDYDIETIMIDGGNGSRFAKYKMKQTK